MLGKLLRKTIRSDRAEGEPDLPPAEVCSLELLKRSSEAVPSRWRSIDVYPPMAKAIPADPLDGILYRNRERVLDINEALGLSDEQFDALLMPVIRNFASFVHLLPSSEAHHHRGAGGALRHSLEVAFWSARAAEDIIFCRNADPRERRKIEPLWRVATCVAGLLHDAGKPIADVAVTDENGEPWHPLQEPLYEWLRFKRRTGYYISWRGGRYKRHEAFTQRAFDKIVPSSFVTHMMAHDPNIIFAIHDAFYSLDDSNHIAKIINWADQESVRRDAVEDVERKVGADFDYGLPVHRHLFNAIRRLIQSGKWTINQPGAKVWHGDDGTFLVFKHGLDDIISDIKKEVGVAIRKDPDGLTDELIQRGLVKPRYVPGGEPESEEDLGEYYLYWVISPKILSESASGKPVKLTTIKIDSPERIFRNEPPAKADIKVWSTEELGGGVQPEFDSGRGVATIDSQQVNLDTGEVIASEQPGQGDVPTPDTTPTDEAQSGSNNSEAEPQEVPPSNAATDDGIEPAVPETAASDGPEESEEGDQSGQADSTPPPASDDPMQSLIHRSRAGRPAKQPSNTGRKKGNEPKGSGESVERNPDSGGKDLKSVLADIDDDMDMPFGLGADDAEPPTPQAEEESARENIPASEPVDEEPGTVGASEEAKAPDPEPERSSPKKAGQGSGKPKPKPKPKPGGAQNVLLKQKPSSESSSAPTGKTTTKKLGKYKNIQTKKPQAGVQNRPVDSDPREAFSQLIRDNEATGAGEVLQKLVATVVDDGEVLGKRWFILDGAVAIAYPSAFQDIAKSAPNALEQLDKAGVLKPNPKQPMSKVMEVHEVMALVLDERTSGIIINYLQACEQSIDPLYVPPHPDLKLVRKPVQAAPSSEKPGAKSRRKSAKATKKGKNRSNLEPNRAAKREDKSQENKPRKSEQSSAAARSDRVLSRLEEAEAAMAELVDEMIEGKGDLVDDLVVDGPKRSVPHDVTKALRLRYPRLTLTQARQAFWKPAKARGYEWETNQGHFTLSEKN